MRDAADGGGVGEEDAAGVSPFSGLKVGIQGVMEHDDDDDSSFFGRNEDDDEFFFLFFFFFLLYLFIFVLKYV